MKFEDVKMLNKTPFDMEWMQDFYNDTLFSCGDHGYRALIMILIYRYIEKFSEIYKLDLPVMSIEKHFFGDIRGDFFDDIAMDIQAEYSYENTDMFYYSIELSGFEMINFPADIDNLPLEIEETKEVNSVESYLKFLQEVYPSWESILDEMKSEIQDTFTYIESGEIYLLRNKELGIFQKICERYESLINQYLLCEKKAIEEAILTLKYPLCLQDQFKTGYIDDYFYVGFDTGSNGYEYLDFSYINWNWVITCTVIKCMLQDFKEKFRNIVGEYEREEHFESRGFS